MLENLSTEKQNPNTMNLDQMDTSDILREMNLEDSQIYLAVQAQIPVITRMINDIVHSLKSGGRLIYMGAGTSGRLGVLDAVECEPTFGVDSSQIFGLIAGGEKAMFHAVEGAEDSFELGQQDLENARLSENDTVIGITASGRTPYVLGGIDYAKKIGASVGGVTCNSGSELAQHAPNCAEIVTGPEILTGSTRLKSGTAQKMVLNMISTISMIRFGKVYGNLMVDLHATNEKLVDRAIRIIKRATNVSNEKAEEMLKKANYETKPAIVAILQSVSVKDAYKLLDENNGFVRKIVD